jgi:hypothetical protein
MYFPRNGANQERLPRSNRQRRLTNRESGTVVSGEEAVIAAVVKAVDIEENVVSVRKETDHKVEIAVPANRVIGQPARKASDARARKDKETSHVPRDRGREDRVANDHRVSRAHRENVVSVRKEPGRRASGKSSLLRLDRFQRLRLSLLNRR